jgi:hypothetical protein
MTGVGVGAAFTAVDCAYTRPVAASRPYINRNSMIEGVAIARARLTLRSGRERVGRD